MQMSLVIHWAGPLTQRVGKRVVSYDLLTIWAQEPQTGTRMPSWATHIALLMMNLQSR